MATIARRDRTARAARAASDVPSDRERQLVSEAILLVSRGGSPRVTVAGLRNPGLVIEASRELATARGVRLVTLRSNDERGADVAVEAIGARVALDQPAAVERVRPAATFRAAARGA